MAAMKDSGVEWIGDIPEEWGLSKVKYQFDNHDSKRIPVESSERQHTYCDVYPYYGANGIQDYVNNYIFDFDAILVGEDGSVIHDDGTPFVTIARDRYWVNNHAHVLTPRHQILFDYAAFALTVADMRKVVNGSTRQKLTQGDLGRVPIPLPTVNEQRLIASYLQGKSEEIDEVTSIVEFQISTLERYRASVIHEAVTRGLDLAAPTKPSTVDWIGDIPEGWEIKKLKHLVVSFESGTSVRAASYPADVGEKGVLSLSAVFGGKYNPTANKRIDDDELSRASCPVKSGSLLVSRCNTSEWVGLPAFVEQGDPSLYLPDKLWQIDCGSPLLNKFVWYALHSKGSRDYCAVMSFGSSASMQNIASFDLLNMYVAVPSAMEEVSAVVAFLDSKLPAIDAVISTKRAQLDVLKRRRQSLIYEYVTGKRRVSQEG